jgi:hypothetical protein
MALSYKNLQSYYKELFEMKRYGNYTMDELNSMIPWELDITEIQLFEALKEEGKNK